MRLDIDAYCNLRINDNVRDIMFRLSAGTTMVSGVGLLNLLLMKLPNGEVTGVDDAVNNVQTGFYKRLVFTNDGTTEHILDLPVAKIDMYETDREYIYEGTVSHSALNVNSQTGTLYLVKASVIFKGTTVTYDNVQGVYNVTATDVEILTLNLDRNPFAEDIPLVNNPIYSRGIKVNFDGVNNVVFNSEIVFVSPKNTY